ncbi:hypothetical protein [Streptomyces sp. SID13031]|nr:hypothetical protein [Streptomyces sp. SID13031]
MSARGWLRGASPTWSTVLLTFTILEVVLPLALIPAALRRPRAGR